MTGAYTFASLPPAPAHDVHQSSDMVAHVLDIHRDVADSAMTGIQQMCVDEDVSVTDGVNHGIGVTVLVPGGNSIDHAEMFDDMGKSDGITYVGPPRMEPPS